MVGGSAELLGDDAALQCMVAVEQQGHRSLGLCRDDDLADIGDLVMFGCGVDGALVAGEDLEVDLGVAGQQRTSPPSPPTTTPTSAAASGTKVYRSARSEAAAAARVLPVSAIRAMRCTSPSA